MIGTERLRTGINDAAAGLCVTFGGAVDWKSRQLKPTAQSTTEFRNKPMIDASNGMSGKGMAWIGFCLLFVFCLFFCGLGFYGRDNALEEC